MLNNQFDEFLFYFRFQFILSYEDAEIDSKLHQTLNEKEEFSFKIFDFNYQLKILIIYQYF